MTFQEALTLMQAGVPMRRTEWPERHRMVVRDGALILLRNGDEGILGYPDIIRGGLSTTSIFATDWEEVE